MKNQRGPNSQPPFSAPPPPPRKIGLSKLGYDDFEYFCFLGTAESFQLRIEIMTLSERLLIVSNSLKSGFPFGH